MLGGTISRRWNGDTASVVSDMPTASTNLPPDLSIVIPVLNEADKIRADIMAAAAYCHNRGLRVEIVISDDGSDDDSIQVARQSQA